MTKIINHIYNITKITNFNFIQIVEIHLWNVLQTFKTRFTFFDSTKNLKLKQQYNRMIKNSFNRQNIDDWLNDYLKMLIFVKQTKIVEIIDNKRAYRDFLHAIEKIAFIFVEIYEFQLKIVTNHETQFFVFIDIFRHHMRMKKVKKKRYSIRHLLLTKAKLQTIEFFLAFFHFENKFNLAIFVIAKKNIYTTIVLTSTKKYVQKNK